MKLRSAITPVALLVLASATIVYAYAVDRRRISDADRAARRTDVFPSFRVDDAKRIELVHGSERLVLERDAAAAAHGWRITSPRDEPADGAAIDVLLRELEMAMRVRDVPADEAAGLDAPRVHGTIAMGAITYVFALGSDAPRPEGAAYMRIDGEGTFVVGRALAVQLLRGADAYRERTLVPWGTADIARLEVRTPDGRTFAVERAGATFRVAGAGLRADRERVERLFRGLADARADAFLDDATADRATATGARTTTVIIDAKKEGEPRVELLLGDVCPGEPADVVAVRRAPTRAAACVPRVSLESLHVDTTALVDRHPLYARSDEIAELRLAMTDGSTGVDLARRASTWHLRAPEDRDLSADEAESANALAAALSSAEAIDARKPAAGEAFVPRARVTVVRAGGGTEEEVDVAASGGAEGESLARRADDGAMLRLPRAVARRFEPHPVAVRSRAVWRAPFDPGAVVGIAGDCGPSQQRIELRDARTWMMRAPAGFTPDALAVTDLAEAVAHARADAWIAETDDGGFGFGGVGSCSVTLTVGVPDAGDRRATIVFGADGDGGAYARTSEDAAVFVAPAILRGLASHPMIDRRRFRVDTASLARATVVRDGATIVLSRDGDRLLRADGAAGDGGADALEAALGAFSAQTALHTGPAAAGEGFDHPTLEIRADARENAGETRITVGAPTRVDGLDAYFARIAGVDATFAVPKAAVGAVLAVP
jgi:hypothetical protein